MKSNYLLTTCVTDRLHDVTNRVFLFLCSLQDQGIVAYLYLFRNVTTHESGLLI